MRYIHKAKCARLSDFERPLNIRGRLVPAL